MVVRTEQLIHEIANIDADIIGLQEVMPDFWKELVAYVDYKHHAYKIIQQRGDGLAILSKYPFTSIFFLNDSDEFDNSFALNVLFEENGMKFSVTNVHLPCDSVLAREKQIVAINEHACRQKDQADFFLLLGDFNCSHSSSIHNFLLGEQTLLGCEANPVWFDLAEVHAALNDYGIMPTLDFATNPRWGAKNTKYIPVACDSIYLMDNAVKFDYDISNVSIFGTDVSSETGLAPSDHYGVLSEVTFRQ